MKDFDEKDFDELKQKVKDNEKCVISGNINTINYEINLSKPIRVVFKCDNNEIEFYSGKLASSKIEIYKEEKRVHYRKKNSLNVGVTLIKIVDVCKSEINNKCCITERYCVREQFDDCMIPKKCEKIIEDIIANDDRIQCARDGEFYKENIDNDEELNKLIHNEEELNKYLIDGSKTKLGDFPSGFYEDRHDYEFNKKNCRSESFGFDYCIEKADKEIEEYKELLNRINIIVDEKVEEIKENIKEKNKEETEKIEEDTVDKVEEETTKDTEENEQEGISITEINLNDIIKEFTINSENNNESYKIIKQNENEENNYQDVAKNEVEEKDITEINLSSIINELAEKQREEERDRIRIDKINKVKELMSLNKQLDEELNNIMNCKKVEGED